jgi:drug/metabolite transporter (DMT)-like permease
MELSTYGDEGAVYALAYAVAYLAVATVLILANKHLITETSFNCPIFVSSLGSWFGWLIAWIAIKMDPKRMSHRLSASEWVSNILPIGFCTALSLAAANMAYSYLSLSFIQMLKAFAPVVCYFTLVAFGLDRWSGRIIATLSVVMIGCFIAAWGEAHVTAFGLACMFIAEISEAFRSVGVQYLIANKRFSLFNGMYYFSPATLVFLMALSLAFEREELSRAGNVDVLRRYWYLFVICATFGFAVNYVCLGVVKHAGSLMVKTMSQLKNVVVIAAAMFIYGDEVSALEMIGYAIATAGFIAFNQAKSLDNVKVREIVAERARRASASDETEPLVVRPSPTPTKPSPRAADAAL